MSRVNPTPDERRIGKFYKDGNSIEVTAMEFNISTNLVRTILKKCNIETRINPHRTEMSKEEVISKAKQHFENGLSYQEIADLLNKDVGYIKTLINAKQKETPTEVLDREAVRPPKVLPKAYKVEAEGKKYLDITEFIFYDKEL